MADAFLRAQEAWLEANLSEGAVLVGMDEYGRPMLPARAQGIYYSRPGPHDTVGYYVNHRTCEVDSVVFRMPEPVQRRDSAAGAGRARAMPRPRPPVLT